jgi:hypothetical protein
MTGKDSKLRSLFDLLGIWLEKRIGGFRSGSLGLEGEAKGVEDLLFFLELPPTGTLRREPPSVQYLRQPLQKYLGCVRL